VQRIRVRGTARNNRVFNVLSVELVGAFTEITVREIIAQENAPTAIFEEVTATSLTGAWYNGAVTSIREQDPVEDQYLHPLGHIYSYDKWNQYNRVFRIFDCNIRGLNTSTAVPDLLHTFFITDTSPHTTGKYFLLLHFEMDFYRCTWAGYFIEVYGKEKTYADLKEFKYIEA
jgi:hypothetical protein